MVDTLAKMRMAGHVDEDEELTTPAEETGPESETELVLEDVGHVEEESEEEDAHGDEQDAPTRKEKPKKSVQQTLGHLRRQRRELRQDNAGLTQDNASLTQENASLRAELDMLKDAVLKKPRSIDYDNDDDYEAALLRYHRVKGESSAPRPVQQRPNEPQQQAPAMDFTDAVNAHYDRAEALGVDASKFEAAEKSVRGKLGDVLTDALIDAVGEGSEKAIMVLGTNPREFGEFESRLRGDPSGTKAVAYLGKLAERTRVTKRKRSESPKPTRTPAGGSSGVNAAERKLEKAEKSGNTQAIFRATRELRKAKREAARSK